MRSFRPALRVAPIVLVPFCPQFHLMQICMARLGSLFRSTVEVTKPLTNPPNWIAPPADLIGIEVQIIAVNEVRIDEGRQQILRRGNCMKIAVEMEIDLVARLDLREATPGGTSFHAEDSAKRRFVRGQDGLLAHLGESLYQAFSRDSLALAGSSERGCGNENQVSASRQGRS